jgi:hypothetical protein
MRAKYSNAVISVTYLFSAAESFITAVIILCLLLNCLALKPVIGTEFGDAFAQAIENQSVLADVVTLTVVPMELVHQLLMAAVPFSPAPQRTPQKSREKQYPDTSADYFLLTTEKRTAAGRYDLPHERGDRMNLFCAAVFRPLLPLNRDGPPPGNQWRFFLPLFLICFFLLPRRSVDDDVMYIGHCLFNPACRTKAGFFYWRIPQSTVLEGGTNV